MGNRQELGIYLTVINPSINPYLHVVSCDGGKTYEYVPNLSGISISLGRITKSTTPIEYSLKKRIDIPLLPENPVDMLPLPIDTASHVEIRLQEFKGTLLEMIDSTTNIIVCRHGSYWGLLPEQKIADILSEKYNVRNMFPRVGGRKRVQDHAVIINNLPFISEKGK